MTYAEWVRRYRDLRDRAERIARLRIDRAYALAATVGIPRDGCSLPNASIDTGLSGWCYQNPRRLKVAKQARHIEDSAWEGYRLLERWCARHPCPLR